MSDEASLRNKLRVMVESELYFQVRALSEGKLVINSFFASLPEEYKNLPDAYEIIYDTLNKLEQKENEQKQEER